MCCYRKSEYARETAIGSTEGGKRKEYRSSQLTEYSLTVQTRRFLIITIRRKVTCLPLSILHCHIFQCFQQTGCRVPRTQTTNLIPRCCVNCWHLHGFCHPVGGTKNKVRYDRRVSAMRNMWPRKRNLLSLICCDRIFSDPEFDNWFLTCRAY